MTTFAGALLSIHLGVLDMTAGARSEPDQIDIGIAEDGITTVLTAHVGDEAVAVNFTPEYSIEEYRAALNAPAPLLLLPNGRVLDDAEAWKRINAGTSATH